MSATKWLVGAIASFSITVFSLAYSFGLYIRAHPLHIQPIHVDSSGGGMLLFFGIIYGVFGGLIFLVVWSMEQMVDQDNDEEECK